MPPRLFGVSILLIVVWCAPLPATPQFDHIVVVIEENHSNQDIYGNLDAPYINWLADHGARFDTFFAITHPSQPNYLEFFSGSDQGVRSNSPPGIFPFTTPNLGGNLLAVGRTFTSYSQGLPAAGSNVFENGDYARRHNPAANWQADIPGPNQIPRSANQPFTAFPTDFNQLPNVSVVVPDLRYDMHDGSIRDGDRWLQDNLGAYANWAKNHNSLLVVTWDEDSFRSVGNQIPTLFYGAGIAQTRLQSAWTLHNLLRTVEDLNGTQYAGRSALVQPIKGAFVGDGAQATLVLKNGAQNYHDTRDTYIRADMPNTAFHGEQFMLATQQADRVTQALIRFDNLFGGGDRQVKTNREILSAKLVIPYSFGRPSTPSFNAEIHRMLVDWNEQSTWNSLGGGIKLDDAMAAAQAEFTWTPAAENAGAVFDVTESLRQWKQGAANFGWVIVSNSEQMFQGVATEDTTKEFLPFLSITYAFKSAWQSSAAGAWTQANNWSDGVPLGPESTAVFGQVGNEPHTVVVAAPTAIGGLKFDSSSSYTIAGNGPLILAELGRTPTIDVFQGNHTITAPLTLQTNAAITTAAGTQLLLAGPVIGAGRLNNNGLGQLAIAGEATLGRLSGDGNLLVTGSLTVGRIEQRRLTITGHVTIAGGTAAANEIDDLQIFGGTLDIGNHALVLRPTTGVPSAVQEIQSQIAAGFARGLWNGPGLQSSLAAADETHQIAIGVMPSDSAQGQPLASIFGVPADSGALLVRTTLYGDANLDGLIDDADFARIANGLSNGLSGWWNGDFNYDGVVDGTDFALIDNAFHFQSGPLAEGVLRRLRGIPVPEPSGILLAVATLGILFTRVLSPDARRM